MEEQDTLEIFKESHSEVLSRLNEIFDEGVFELFREKNGNREYFTIASLSSDKCTQSPLGYIGTALINATTISWLNILSQPPIKYSAASYLAYYVL